MRMQAAVGEDAFKPEVERLGSSDVDRLTQTCEYRESAGNLSQQRCPHGNIRIGFF